MPARARLIPSERSDSVRAVTDRQIEPLGSGAGHKDQAPGVGSKGLRLYPPLEAGFDTYCAWLDDMRRRTRRMATEWARAYHLRRLLELEQIPA